MFKEISSNENWKKNVSGKARLVNYMEED
jgi:hypothetical protein